MTKDQTFATDLAHFCHHQHWDLNRVTTATALVVNLEQNSYTGILWDLAATNLDTTIATMTLIRHQQNGPLLVFSPTGSDASFSGPRSTTYWKKTSPTTFYDH